MFNATRITRRRLIVSAVPAAFLGVFLAGCGGSSPTGSQQAGPSAAAAAGAGGATVTAIANDFSYKFSTANVSAGTVHFTLQNQSKTYKHELWVYPQNQPKLQAMIAAKDASKSDGSDVDEGDYLQNVTGKAEDVDPGKSASFDATLQPGTYEMACFVTTGIGGKNMVHYEMGMHGLLTVQ